MRHTLNAYDIGAADRRRSVTLAIDAAGHNLIEAMRRLDPGHRPQPVATDVDERLDVIERDIERLFDLVRNR